MVSRECQSARCLTKNYHRRALWMVNGDLYCNACFEIWMESHFIDQHRVMRLSDDEDDFGNDSANKIRRRYQKKVLEFPQPAA